MEKPKLIFIVVAVVGFTIAVICNLKHRKPASAPVVYESYFEEGASPTVTDLFAVYDKLGYGAVVDALKAKSRPCFRLVTDPSPEKSLGSRIGGRPDLPDIGLWPKYKGKSMSFIAQVNLDEIAAAARQPLLPAGGMLYVFYDADQSTWGFDPKDRGSWAVLYRETPSEAAPPADYPSDLPKEARYKSVPVKLQAEQSIPDPSEVLSDLLLSEEQQDEVDEVYAQFLEGAVPHHQLLGYPEPIQDNEMELQCQLTSHGIYTGDAKGYKDPRVKSLKRGAKNWRLLLQIDSDEAAGMMWGDVGRLYFWITQDNLKNKRFENVWMISQCY